MNRFLPNFRINPAVDEKNAPNLSRLRELKGGAARDPPTGLASNSLGPVSAPLIQTLPPMRSQHPHSTPKAQKNTSFDASRPELLPGRTAMDSVRPKNLKVIVPAPAPAPAIPPRPVPIVSVSTRPTHEQVPIPPDVWIPVSDGDDIRLPPHELSLKLHTLRLYLLNLKCRLRLRPFHRLSSHRATDRSSWPLPSLRTLTILITIRRPAELRTLRLRAVMNLITVKGLRIRRRRLRCCKWISLVPLS